MRRWIRFIARLYPSSWRVRYGDEFDALLEDVRPGWRELVNVLRGALAMQLTMWTFGKTVLAVGLAGALVAGAISLRIENRYVSCGVLSVPGHVNAGDMSTLLAEAFSRHYLNTLIQQENLYKAERARQPLEDIIEGMRHDITLSTYGGSDTATKFVVGFWYSDAALAERTNREIMSRLQEMQAKVYGRADVLDPASLPERASSPNRAMMILCGLAAGLLLGGAGIAVRRRLRWTSRVAAVGLGAMLCGAAASYLIPGQYVSHAVIRVPPMEPPFSVQARSRALLAKSISGAKLYERLRDAKSMDAAVEQMGRHLTVTEIVSSRGYQVERIAFRYTDRHKAQAAVQNIIANVIIEYASRQSGVNLPPADSPDYNREFLAWRATSPKMFEMIDAPSLPESPAGPNRMVIAMLGLAAGVLAGAWWWRRRPLGTPGAVVQPAG